MEMDGETFWTPPFRGFMHILKVLEKKRGRSSDSVSGWKPVLSEGTKLGSVNTCGLVWSMVRRESGAA